MKKTSRKKIYFIFGLILFAIWYILHSNLNSNIEKNSIDIPFDNIFEENSEIKIPKELKNNIDFWKRIFFKKNGYSVIYYTPDQNINIKQVDIIPDISLNNKGIVNIILKSNDEELSRFTLFDLLDASNPDQLFSQKQIRGKIDEIYDDLNELLHKNGTLKSHENIGYTRGKKEKSKNALIKSGKFINQIKKIFKEENIPEEIAYLAFTESFFDYNAISSNNARGIFQMIPQTARNYGLIVNKNVDERRDPFLEAKATAKYLHFLYEEFNNWLWTLNAYHSGEYNLKKALAWANKKYPKKSDNFSGNLKEYQYIKVVNEFPQDKEFNNTKNIRYGTQSARYTTLFLAFLEGEKELEKEIIKEKTIYFDTIKINYKKDYKKEKEIIIQSGDTLLDLAYQNGITVDDIKNWNNLENSFIKSGNKLILWIEEPPLSFNNIIDKLNLSPKEIEFIWNYNFSYHKDNQSKLDFLSQKIYSNSKINLPLGKGNHFNNLLNNY